MNHEWIKTWLLWFSEVTLSCLEILGTSCCHVVLEMWATRGQLRWNGCQSTDKAPKRTLSLKHYSIKQVKQNEYILEITYYHNRGTLKGKIMGKWCTMFGVNWISSQYLIWETSSITSMNLRTASKLYMLWLNVLFVIIRSRRSPPPPARFSPVIQVSFSLVHILQLSRSWLPHLFCQGNTNRANVSRLCLHLDAYVYLWLHANQSTVPPPFMVTAQHQ